TAPSFPSGGAGTPLPGGGQTVLGPVSLPTATAAPVTGKLLITHQGNFFVLDLSTRQETQLSHFPTDAFATSPVLSPDGKRIAYTYFAIPQDKNELGGNDLATIDVTGANEQIVRKHGQ